MSYIEELQRKEAAVADAARETSNRAAFSTICDHWPLAASEANFKMLAEWCGGDITVSKFQIFVDTNPAAFTLDWSGTRDRILADIANELDYNGARLTQSDLNALFQRRARGEQVTIDQLVVGKSRNIDNEIAKMQFWSKAQLRSKLAELRYRREVRQKSVSDLQADLAAHRNAPSAGNAWAPFEMMPTTISATEIKMASSHKIKFLNAKYGVAQVNARLNGRA